MNTAFLWNWPINEFTGGVGIVTKVLANEMLSRGNQVIFIALVSDAEKIRNAKQLESIGFHQATYPYIAPQYYVSSDLGLDEIVSKIERILNENNIEIILNQDIDTQALNVLHNLSDKYLKVVNKHSQPFEGYAFTQKVYKGYVAKTLTKRLWKTAVLACPALGRWNSRRVNFPLYAHALDSADRLCLLSSGFISRLLHFMPKLDRRKLCYVNNPNTFEVKGLTLSDKENLVVIVCRLVESTKNVTDFMKAWKMIEEKHPNWKAEIVGDGKDMEMLKNRAEKLGLASLSFVGYHSDVSSFYERAKMVCVTSWYEGWGMTITEGMANGCVPLVYDTYEAITDIFDDGKSGFVVKSCKPKELAEKMIKLMDDSKLLESMGMQAYEKSKQFSPSNIVDKWEKLFKEIKEEKDV